MFKINGRPFVEPITLTMLRQPHVAAELTTQSGRIVGDIRGWKYGDTTLEWGTIPAADAIMLSGLSSFQMTFDELGGERTVTARIVSFGRQKQRFRVDGQPFFANFEVEVIFPDVYNN